MKATIQCIIYGVNRNIFPLVVQSQNLVLQIIMIKRCFWSITKIIIIFKPRMLQILNQLINIFLLSIGFDMLSPIFPHLSCSHSLPRQGDLSIPHSSSQSILVDSTPWNWYRLADEGAPFQRFLKGPDQSFVDLRFPVP